MGHPDPGGFPMRRTALVLPLALLALLGSLGCRSKSPAAGAAAEQPKGPALGTEGAPQSTAITGTVLERIDAEPYTYLRLKTADGEKWAAVPTTDLKVGAQATLSSQIEMRDFESKSLKRKFAQVYFGNLANGAAAPAADPHGATAPAVSPAGPVKVEKASGADARTIAEVFAQRQSLVGKTVVVRGKVMKFLPEIMKKNWIHLQDGTGDEKAKTHDLTFTTTDTVAAGDVVTLKGTLRLNKDFGSGYTYEVIVEEAKVQK